MTGSAFSTALASGFAYVEHVAGAQVRSINNSTEGDRQKLRVRDGVAEIFVVVTKGEDRADESALTEMMKPRDAVASASAR